MTDTPYMPLWIRDFVGDTTHLTAEETGAYILLLGAMWLRGGTLDTSDMSDLCRMARVHPSRWSRVWLRLLPFFTVVDDKTLIQKRLADELKRTSGIREANSQKATLGWRTRRNKNNKLAPDEHIISNVSHTHTHIKEDSVAKATGAAPLLDFKKEAFRKGVNMLVAEGVPEKQARSLVGKWRKLSGGDDEALVELLDRAADVDPVVLAEWMGAALNNSVTRIQMRGESYLIPPQTEQWEAWHKFFIRLNDPRIYTKGVLTVPSLWPRG
jgi:uncharacterized protein YdaU (DUF1376 family)